MPESDDIMDMDVEELETEKSIVEQLVEVAKEILPKAETATGDSVTTINSSASEEWSSSSAESDAAGMALLQGYGEKVKMTEEYAMEFLCNQVQHPVISCFRELGSQDLNLLIGNNKIKKRNGTLEQSIIYIGLIDCIAVTINNPLYSEKLMKNIPTKIQKIMLDFKNVIGSWGLSDYPTFRNRYNIVMKYLRGLVPYFKPVKFEDTFNKILDSIETEIGRNRQNYEKIKAITSTNSSVSSNIDENLFRKTDIGDGDKETMREIDLNITLNVDENENEDEDVSLSLSPTWASLKPPPNRQLKKNLTKRKKVSESIVSKKKCRLEIIDIEQDPMNEPLQSSIGSVATSSAATKTPPSKKYAVKSKKSINLKKHKISLPALSGPDVTSNRSLCALNSEGEPAEMIEIKKFEMDSEDGLRSKLSSIKGTIDSNLSKEKRKSLKGKNRQNETNQAKKPRMEVIDVTIEVKSKIDKAAQNTGDSETNKPKVNAFALLMNRSREIAEQRKLQKLAEKLPLSTLQGSALKSA